MAEGTLVNGVEDSIELVVACDLERGIGKNDGLPWRLPGDLKHFRDVTSSCADPSAPNAVIVGRKTWESIPPRHRPLPNRINLVLTRDESYEVPEGVLKAASLDEALSMLKMIDVNKCFVIGGGQIYREAIVHPWCDYIHLTEVMGAYECDTFFPDYSDHYDTQSSSDVMEENGIQYRFHLLKRRPSDR